MRRYKTGDAEYVEINTTGEWNEDDEDLSDVENWSEEPGDWVPLW